MEALSKWFFSPDPVLPPHEPSFKNAVTCLRKGDIRGALISAEQAEQNCPNALIEVGLKFEAKGQGCDYFTALLNTPQYAHKHREAAFELIKLQFQYLAPDNKNIALWAKKVTESFPEGEDQEEFQNMLIGLGEMYLENSLWVDRTHLAKPLLDQIDIVINATKYPKMKAFQEIEQWNLLPQTSTNSIN